MIRSDETEDDLQTKSINGRVKVTVVDLATLLLNAYACAKDLDAEEVFDELVKRVDRTYAISIDDMEKLLSLCNFNDEKGKYESVDGKTFKALLKTVGIDGFDTRYNWILEDGK